MTVTTSSPSVQMMTPAFGDKPCARCAWRSVCGFKNETRCLPLPIAGLMSDADGREVAAQYVLLNQLAAACGCPLAAPLMTLSFWRCW